MMMYLAWVGQGEEMTRRCRQGKKGTSRRARQENPEGTGALTEIDGHRMYIKIHKQGVQGWLGLWRLPRDRQTD